jgi:hypothetical protein
LVPAQYKNCHADFWFDSWFGLAVKIQEYEVPDDGLLANLISFNIGVELGQFMALAIILLLDDVEKNPLFLQNSISKQCLLDVPWFSTCWLPTHWLHYSIRI